MNTFLQKQDFRRLRSMEKINNLAPRQFEYFTKFLLEEEGYERVQVTVKHGAHGADDGVDILAFRDGKRIAGQCKHWLKGKGIYESVPVKEIRALGGSMTMKGATAGVFASTLPYGKVATNAARRLQIRLIGPDDIQAVMKKVNPLFERKDTLRMVKDV